MFFTNLRRITKTGILNYKRNGWLSTATVLVMILMLFVIGNLVFTGALASVILSSFESKVDISVYFLPDAPENSIISIKKELETLPDVRDINYISREAALELFRNRHKGNQLIAAALEEIGENPLQASLNIRAKDPSRYAAISEFLLQKNYREIDKINYFENQQVIERMGAIFKTLRGAGTFLAFFLAFIAVLVTFNTIRLAIYTMREEIGIMRLVGASKWFIRGPFIVSGILYGATSALITLMVFFPLIWLISPRLALLVPEFNIFQYFLDNLIVFAVLMFGGGIVIGVLSSWIAIRRYLQV